MKILSKLKSTKILFLVYHYLKRNDEYKRIWGYDFDLFKKQIGELLKQYKPIDYLQFYQYLQGKTELPPRCLVLSFDDGLAEHARIISPWLNSLGVKALFSLPTCALDNIIAPPQVIHFITARYGIKKFFYYLRKYFPVLGLQWADYFPQEINKLELMKFYSEIKKVLLYKIAPDKTFELLSKMAEEVLIKNDKDILRKIYMSKKDLERISRAGHQIGCHTYSHPSFVLLNLNKEIWEKEIVRPKKTLEKAADSQVMVFAYPYGGWGHDFDKENWTKKLKTAGFAFALNAYRTYDGDRSFDPYWIERYSVHSADDASAIKNNAFIYEFPPKQ